MSFNSIYGIINKASNNNNILNFNKLSNKNLPEFFVKIMTKSKSQNDIKNNNIINNNKNNNNIFNKININTNNINKEVQNFNHINKKIIIKKDDIFQKQKKDLKDIINKRKFSESSKLNIRKNKIKKDENYHHNEKCNGKNDKVIKNNNTNINNIKNLSKKNINNNTNYNISVY